MKNMNKLMMLGVFAVLMFGFAVRSHAILLTETQVLINPKDRVASLTVKNTSSESEIFRFEFNEMYVPEGRGLKLLEEGETVEGLNAASDFIRFSPRRLKLAPGQVQQVRFLVRRTKDMKDGEYRSYFSLRPEPKVPGVDGEPEKGMVETGLKVGVGWRIPVILRHGKLAVEGKLRDVRVEEAGGKTKVHFTIEREGNMGLMGSTKVVCVSDGNAVLGQGGARVYTERKQVKSFVVLKDGTQGCKNMVLEYTALPDDPVFSGGLIASAPVN